MADLKYRVDVDTKQAQNNLNTFKNTIRGVGAALATLGVAKVVKSFVDVGSSVEKLGLRFKFLFGSAQEGAKAFDNLVKFAAKVPFSLQEIEAASGNLAVVSKDADHLNELLKITGNVAAVTGLDFRTTGEQIQRAFSGGIASADIFRERGVRALLGFEQGATVSIEETIKRFQEVFGEGGKFGKATDEFANTLEGTISMLGDKLFKFQKDVATGFFDELKFQLGDLNKFFDDNADVIREYAQTIGEGLANAIRGTVQVIVFLKENIDAVKAAFVALAIGKITATFLTLATAIRNTATAMGVLNVVMGKNPFIKIFSAAMAAGTGLLYYFNKTSDATKATEEFNKIAKDTAKLANEMSEGSIPVPVNSEKTKKAVDETSATIKKLREKIEKDFDKINRELQLDKGLKGLTGFDRKLKEIEIQEKKTMLATIERIKAAGKDLKGQDQLIKDVQAQTEAVIKEKQKQAQAQEELERSFTFGMEQAMKEYVKNVTNGAEQARRVFEQATQGMEDAIVNFVKTGKFSFRSLINDILETLLRSRIQELFARIFTMGSGGGNSPGMFDILGSIGKGIKDIFGGFFADGGMLGAGKYGIAGERGMELVGPGPAQITPLQGGGQVTYNINAVDARSFQELVASDPQFIFAVTEQGRKTVPEFRR